MLSDYINLSSDVIFRFVAEDILYTGDAGSGGSLVEAGLDDFFIEYISLPSIIEGDINNDDVVNVLDMPNTSHWRLTQQILTHVLSYPFLYHSFVIKISKFSSILSGAYMQHLLQPAGCN